MMAPELLDVIRDAPNDFIRLGSTECSRPTVAHMLLSTSIWVFSVNASLVANAGNSNTIRVALLPENVDDTMYDVIASCMVRDGSVMMESRTALAD